MPPGIKPVATADTNLTITEWSVKPRSVAGFDRTRSIVAYRIWNELSMAKRRNSTPGPYLRELHFARDPDAIGYPHALPSFRNLTTLAFHPKVTFLVGENGSGKSTLLEAIAIACGLNPEGGGRNFNFSTRDSHSNLADCIRLTKTIATAADDYFLRAESFFNVATQIEQLDVGRSYGKKSLHEQSHGESFFALFENRFGDHGLYLMDEPEAALSPQRQLQFLSLMHHYLERGGQFVIATHSPIIMAYPEAVIYHLDATGTREVAYADTEHFKVTQGFLRNPAKSLRILLDLADES